MKIKTEDLRAGLNAFSPEQQIEKEVRQLMQVPRLWLTFQKC